jgi:integrating conjugative element membrane protein (TIGR03747 family)
LIEWVGIAWFWPEQGERHAQKMLQIETRYLNRRLVQHSESIGQTIVQTTADINRRVQQESGFFSWASRQASSHNERQAYLHAALPQFYWEHRAYFMAVPFITQLFFVRLAIILFSLPAFLLCALVGIIDGLSERDLRRWGGGRESSNLYNIARKSVYPAFIAACVFYISIPVTLHPGWIITPFAVLLGLATKVTFGRLKKYF